MKFKVTRAVLSLWLGMGALAAFGQDVKREALRQEIEHMIKEPREVGNGDGSSARAEEPKSHGKSFYSTQFPEQPPFPWNPFPELPLFEIGEGKFRFDDSTVKYSKERSPATETYFAEGSQFGSLLSASSYSGTELHVTIERLSGTSFELLITNLVVGRDYLVTDKLDLRNDIAINWRPVLSFTAEASSATLAGTFLEQNQFFRVWDLTLYSGPVIELRSPTNGEFSPGP